ncbi:MAG: helix-turn-helix domain-containing protein [Sphingobacterium sp.]|uniref:helix-turn-helix domain-containing protein n=1 Tax=Sphingobacterium sp. TaxID=341027 RepID=UPI00283EB5BC|nr:helix-turn-helix domain-containing protein [Sphingobacterium sp.]MDR3011043.1 helix-turn-helix domain-containing protein [Sphingobacterium sp.]
MKHLLYCNFGNNSSKHIYHMNRVSMDYDLCQRVKNDALTMDVKINKYRNNLSGTKKYPVILSKIEGPIQEVESMESNSNRFILLLCNNGHGLHRINSINYGIGAHHVHLVFPGQDHQMQLDATTEIYSISVDCSFSSVLSTSLKFSFSQYQDYPVIKLSSKSHANMLAEFEWIHLELSTGDPAWEIVRLRLMIVGEIINKEILRMFKRDKRRKNLLVSRFMQLLDQQFRAEKHTAFYAEKLSVTPSYLNMACKKILSLTATEVIQERVIEEAKKELNNGDLSIKEIGMNLGYADTSYFTRFFRLKTGMAPNRFRSERH